MVMPWGFGAQRWTHQVYFLGCVGASHRKSVGLIQG